MAPLKLGFRIGRVFLRLVVVFLFGFYVQQLETWRADVGLVNLGVFFLFSVLGLKSLWFSVGIHLLSSFLISRKVSGATYQIVR